MNNNDRIEKVDNAELQNNKLNEFVNVKAENIVNHSQNNYKNEQVNQYKPKVSTFRALIVFVRMYAKIIVPIMIILIVAVIVLSAINTYQNATFTRIDENGESIVYSRDEINEIIDTAYIYTSQSQYLEAVDLYNKIPKTYDNYNIIEEKLETSKNNYISDISNDILAMAQNGEYQNAVDMINSAQLLVGENQVLNDVKNNVIKLYEENALIEINALIEDKKFLNAIDLISEALEFTDRSEVLLAKQPETIQEYEQYVLYSVDTLVNEEKYQEAVAMLTNVLTSETSDMMSELMTEKQDSVSILYKTQLADQANSYILNTEYANALNVLYTIQDLGEDENVQNQINSIKVLFEDELLNKAKVEFETSGFETTITILEEGMKSLIFSDRIDDAIKTYEKYAPVQEQEHNGLASDANNIYANAIVYGNISDDDDVDWYQFVLDEPGVVSLNFKHDSVQSNFEYWRVTLYIDNGEDSRTHINTWGVTGNDLEFDTCNIGLTKGTYYVNVKCGVNGTFAKEASSDIEYALTINYDESIYWETEFNDNVYKVDEILLNTTYSGTIFNDDDKDWYKFELSELGTVSINFKHESLQSDFEYWRFTLYTDDGEYSYSKINTWHIEGNDVELNTDRLDLLNGSYYIEVECGVNGTFAKKKSDSTDYHLTVNANVF